MSVRNGDFERRVQSRNRAGKLSTSPTKFTRQKAHRLPLKAKVSKTPSVLTLVHGSALVLP